MAQESVPAMEVSGLTVKFPIRGGVLGKVQNYFTAVEDVSFVLEAGKILSIVGESGCGKSTLVKSLVGLVPMDSGEFKLFGGPHCWKEFWRRTPCFGLGADDFSGSLQ